MDEKERAMRAGGVTRRTRFLVLLPDRSLNWPPCAFVQPNRHFLDNIPLHSIQKEKKNTRENNWEALTIFRVYNALIDHIIIHASRCKGWLWFAQSSTTLGAMMVHYYEHLCSISSPSLSHVNLDCIALGQPYIGADRARPKLRTEMPRILGSVS